MKIEVWIDFLCPFCYLGKTKFEQALQSFEHKEAVSVEYKSFLLRMNSEKTRGQNIHQVIADRYGISYAQAKANNDRITQAGDAVGLHFDFDSVKLNDANLAHQILQYAKSVNKENALIPLVFKAYFEQGMDIGDAKALFEIAEKAGLDIRQLQSALENDTLKAAVAADEAQARKLGIDTIPHFIFDGKHVVSGAAEPQQFLVTLQKVYAEAHA